MAVQMAEEDEGTDLGGEVEAKAASRKTGKKGSLEKKRVRVEWTGEGEKIKHKTFYNTALVNHIQVRDHTHNTAIF